MISIIIPVYNEEKTIGRTLGSLKGFNDIEIIVVDGNSSDKTPEIVTSFPVSLIYMRKNRALQINKGVANARGSILLFLHADCVLEAGFVESIHESIREGYIGGCLHQRIDSENIIYRLIEASGNLRAKLFRIFYGDQAIFIRRDIFLKIGGFDNIALFDDVVFTKKLRDCGKVKILPKKVYVSSRRWQRQGIIKTTFINWLISVGFSLNVPPGFLKKLYADIR